MGITEDGIVGEQKLFGLLKELEFKFFQADAIGEKGDEYFLFECKHQERFNPPPFEGHGLPKRQVEARLKFYNKTGIRPILVIFDKEMKEIFYQAIDTLERLDYYDTKGNSPRRIYKLTSFKKYKQT